jgi:hypothetical protein
MEAILWNLPHTEKNTRKLVLDWLETPKDGHPPPTVEVSCRLLTDKDASKHRSLVPGDRSLSRAEGGGLKPR